MIGLGHVVLELIETIEIGVHRTVVLTVDNLLLESCSNLRNRHGNRIAAELGEVRDPHGVVHYANLQASQIFGLSNFADRVGDPAGIALNQVAEHRNVVLSENFLVNTAKLTVEIILFSCFTGGEQERESHIASFGNNSSNAAVGHVHHFNRAIHHAFNNFTVTAQRA